MGTAAWVDVANAAILKTGNPLIATLNDSATQARICKNRLPRSMAIVLRKYPWKSAMMTVPLASVAGVPADPAWGFSYPLPVDMLRVWAYTPGTPLAGVNFGTNFVIRSGVLWSNDGINADGSGTAPILTYVANPFVPGPGNLDELLLEAIACKLACDVCYQLNQSLPLKQELEKDFKIALQTAKSVDSMETPEVFDFEASELLTARFAGTGFMGPNNPGFPIAP